jgi:hypothetical protein
MEEVEPEPDIVLALRPTGVRVERERLVVAIEGR